MRVLRIQSVSLGLQYIAGSMRNGLQVCKSESRPVIACMTIIFLWLFSQHAPQSCKLPFRWTRVWPNWKEPLRLLTDSPHVTQGHIIMVIHVPVTTLLDSLLLLQYWTLSQAVSSLMTGNACRKFVHTLLPYHDGTPTSFFLACDLDIFM